jgi:membrane-bound lytic murein transglycosylase D
MKLNIFIYINSLFINSIVVCSLIMLAACETISPQGGQQEHAQQPPLSEVPSGEAGNVADLTPTDPDDLWARIRLDLSWQTIDNTRIDQERKALLRQANYLPMIAERANYYLHYIVGEVEKRGMPVEIALIPVVESTLDPFASSYSGAAGLWQIMPRTGRHLGLEQNTWYDGRQALRDSTAGALDYLQSLHDKFDDDWLLALAAYNAGGATIARARRSNEEHGLGTDYWSLKLRRQAYDYIPKIIALSQIVADPHKFGVEIPFVANAPSFEIADPGIALNFAHAAQLAGVDINTLRAFNPGQLRGVFSPHRTTELLLPVGHRDRFVTNVEQLSPDERAKWQTYRVKQGDTLWGIARRFDTDVASLRQTNAIRGNKIRPGDTLNIPGYHTTQTSSLLGDSEAGKPSGYRVRAGDSLYRIADKFKVSVSNIISWNKLDPDNYLQPGQQLTLYLTGS